MKLFLRLKMTASIMKTTNGTTEMLLEQYREITGCSEPNDNTNEGENREHQIEYYSVYEKNGYETHAYSNLTNIKL